MTVHVPHEESLDRGGLERLQRRKLAALLGEVLRSNPFYRHKLDGLSFDAAHDPLTLLPLTTRRELQEDQRDHAPYGTNLTYPLDRYTRLHQTSGSTGTALTWLDTPEDWAWMKTCWSIVFRGAGVAKDDRLAFPFSFGPFIGFWLAFEAAQNLGNFCVAAGGMTTPARLRLILDHAVTVVCCTPTYALHMAEVAETQNLNPSSSAVRLLIVAGEPGGCIPGVRSKMESAWGARVSDHAGMTETGPWGFECAESPGGEHVIESEFIAEIIDPATKGQVADGNPGELVLTTLGRIGSPLIRYRTGDQAVLTRQHCPCGRWFARLEGGIRGRIDDMLFIRGNNVFPSAVENILRGFSEVAEFRMEVVQPTAMTELRLEVEARSGCDGAALTRRIESAIRDRLHFKPLVVVVDPGSLPRFDMKARRVVRHDSDR